jgi:hypothetical protein
VRTPGVQRVVRRDVLLTTLRCFAPVDFILQPVLQQCDHYRTPSLHVTLTQSVHLLACYCAPFLISLQHLHLMIRRRESITA